MKPDPKGFKKLLEQDFFIHKGLVFIKSNVGPNEIDELLKKYSKEDVQRLVNHQELYLYAGFDISLQRKLAKKLKSSWEELLQKKFPNLQPVIEIKDNGIEVVVTVLN